MSPPSRGSSFAEPPALRVEALRGARAFIPLAISVGAYGLVWGVLAGQAGLSLAEVALMSGLVFAGASQFVALDMWTPAGLPMLSIIVATAIVNLRLALMSATVQPLVAHLTRPGAMGTVFFISDEQWALTMAEVHRGRGSLGYLLGASLSCWLAWLGSTVVGRVAGGFIDDPARYGLDFAFTATFLALLLGMWRGRGDVVPWLTAGLTAIAAARLVEGNWYIVVGGLAGSLAGAAVATWRERGDRRAD